MACCVFGMSTVKIKYYLFTKRLFDIILASVLLMLLLPFLADIALFIRLLLGTPVLFRQRRPGLHGRAFTLYKFRTLRNPRDAQGNLPPDEARMTSFGKFLRSLSLDELPTLFNVINGDMSMVGPRPLLMQYLSRYTPEQARRHEVKPGITGWAQVNGRNAITWEQKFALDVWYVDHRSIWLDLKIIALTIWKILKREGINQPGHATMEEFRRNNSKTMRVLIVGAGGHAQVIADILLNMKGKEKELMPIGFLDDNHALHGKNFLGLPVLGPFASCSSIEHDAIIIAIGNNGIRRCLFEKFQIKGEHFFIARHPSSIIASNVSISAGSMICAGTVVNPSSVIGANVILNTGCTIDHHNRLGDHVHIAPGVSLGGEVTIGKGTLVGIGATVMPQCNIGEWSIIGAGALVNQSLPNHVLAVGVPARIIRRLDKEY